MTRTVWFECTLACPTEKDYRTKPPQRRSASFGQENPGEGYAQEKLKLQLVSNMPILTFVPEVKSKDKNG